jgi:hypothetical protein
MPAELKSKEDISKLFDDAIEIRVVRRGDAAKVKVRTKEALYTFKTTTDEADAMTKGLKAEVFEY